MLLDLKFGRDLILLIMFDLQDQKKAVSSTLRPSADGVYRVLWEINQPAVE